VLSREGLSLSEALKLYIFHVCYLEELPFEIQRVFNPVPTPKKSDFIVVTVKRRFYNTFSEVAKKLKLTRAKILYLFIQFINKNKKLPYLFKPDCKKLNNYVMISYCYGRTSHA
jgi:antitoxin component of RelBE/YafQ-DinJ toxin-antitoxin module